MARLFIKARRARAVSIAFQSSFSDAVDRSTYSGALNCGNGKYVVVGFASQNASARTISAVTLGGVACSLLEKRETAGPLGLYIVANPNPGGSATLSVTFSGSAQRFAAGSWSVDGLLSITPIASATNGSGATAAVSTILGGAVFATAERFLASGNFTWTGATEDWELSPESYPHGGASSKIVAQASAHTVTADAAGGSIVLVSMR